MEHKKYLVLFNDDTIPYEPVIATTRKRAMKLGENVSNHNPTAAMAVTENEGADLSEYTEDDFAHEDNHLPLT